MDRETNDIVDLIDLGAASVETQGAGAGLIDQVDFQPRMGLTDD